MGCFLLSGINSNETYKTYLISYMNQVLKFVIQFVYYHQTVFSNNFVLNIYKITLGSILNSEPFHTKKQVTGKRDIEKCIKWFVLHLISF